MHTLQLRHEVFIHALTAKVWEVLTLANYTQQFIFDGELVSEWVSGESILLEVERSGGKQIVEKGKVEEIIPGSFLKFILFGYSEFSSDPVTFQYELISGEGGIRLILFQEMKALSRDMHKILMENCLMMLQKIKWLAEYS
jgi:hypothetical protein